MSEVVLSLDPALAKTDVSDPKAFCLEWLLEMTILLKPDLGDYTAKELYKAARDICPAAPIDR